MNPLRGEEWGRESKRVNVTSTNKQTSSLQFFFSYLYPPNKAVSGVSLVQMISLGGTQGNCLSALSGQRPGSAGILASQGAPNLCIRFTGCHRPQAPPPVCGAHPGLRMVTIAWGHDPGLGIWDGWSQPGPGLWGPMG